ncbi:MAG: hypothetical protein ACLQVX_25825 [Limisphaerales bacterium]
MKTKLHHLHIALALLAVSSLDSEFSTAQAQGTAFTYQGRLNDGGSPANGSYDMAFSLFGAGSGGSQVGGTLTRTAVGVTNGLFTAALDFGAGVFTGANLWLDISVRTNGGGAFSELVPRQPLTPTPYAIMANSASNLLGSLPASQLAGTIALAQMPGAVITNNETGVTLGNVTIGGSLNLPATATLSSGGNSFLAGLSIDENGQNTGNVNANALVFGAPYGLTGEGVASKRSGANPFDLEFYTDFQNRVTIGQNGDVGIGTATPSETLEINGTSRLDGNDMYLRAGTDHNHGLGYRASVSAIPTDGPFLYGWSGGALGTTGPEMIALKWDWHGNIWVSNNLSVVAGLNVDPNNLNVGNVNANSLTFGASSGEGVASKRSGSNPYDLEFYTAFQNRMTIGQNGNVGIGTSTPTETLEINGPSRIDDNDMYLRAGTDGNHGLGYRDIINGVTIDGPFIYGWNGGALGTQNPQSVTLWWNYEGNVWVSNNLSAASLTVRGGADVAEPFPVTGNQVEPGTVMVIDDANPGQLRRSTQAYDTRVAGIISGAGGIQPGLSLQQEGVLDHGQKVALSGRVYVLADASMGPIKPGDLLTTSGAPGRAMKAGDHLRAQGAILGKAMTELKEGDGLVLVLVTLQ